MACILTTSVSMAVLWQLHMPMEPLDPRHSLPSSTPAVADGHWPLSCKTPPGETINHSSTSSETGIVDSSQQVIRPVSELSRLPSICFGRLLSITRRTGMWAYGSNQQMVRVPCCAWPSVAYRALHYIASSPLNTSMQWQIRDSRFDDMKHGRQDSTHAVINRIEPLRPRKGALCFSNPLPLTAAPRP